MLLTTEVARSLAPRNGQRTATYWDDSMMLLGVYTYEGAAPTWVCRGAIGDGMKTIGPAEVFTREEAIELATIKVREQYAGTTEDPSIHRVLDSYLESREPRVQEVTFTGYKRLHKLLKDAIPGTLRVSQINRGVADDWRLSISRKSGPAQARKAIRFLAEAYAWEGHLFPKGAVQEPKRQIKPHVLKRHEWRDLWVALEALIEEEENGWRTRRTLASFWQIAMTTPLRTWSELHPRRWTEYQEIDGVKVLVLPRRKNQHGANTSMHIVLDPLGVEALDAIQGERAGPIFAHAGYANQVVTRYSCEKYFGEALELAGLENVVPRDLRHTAATRLAEAGVDPKVQELLAGATEATLRSTYQHPGIEVAYKAQVNLNYREMLEG